MNKIYPSFLKNRVFKNNNFKNIDFELFELPIEENFNGNSLFNICVVQAFIEKEPSGYLIMAYISDDIKNKYFNNSFEYYIYHYCSENIKKEYANKNFSKIIPEIAKKIGFQKKENNISLTELQQQIDILFGCSYHSFINFWHNRPNEELICVYSNEDKKYKNFNYYPFIKENRNNLLNFRRQGISQVIYEVAGLWMQEKNMFLHKSKTHTSDGLNLWKKLENHPKFQIMLDTYLGNTNINKKKLVEQERKKIFVL